ncbi:MAG: hypothetical protein MUC87_04205 [Bacteroidia bacterium]|jgi:hypothetical protein|nr:hypothetical protein [Bacteroidia bacterium]
MKTIGIFSALIISLSCAAQDKPASKTGGGGSFNTGMAFFDANAMNRFLTAEGFGKLSSTNLSIGGGGVFYRNNWVIGSEGGFAGQRKVSSSTHELRFGYGYGAFQLGYIVAQNSRTLIYPSIGGGFTGASMQISKFNASESLSSVIANGDTLSTSRTRLTAFAPLLKASVNLDFYLSGNENAMYGALLGITAGYQYGGKSAFRSESGTEITNSPSFSASGFFVTLRIGGGYRGTMKNCRSTH